VLKDSGEPVAVIVSTALWSVVRRQRNKIAFASLII